MHSIEHIAEIYHKARERDIIPGAYRLQTLLHSKNFSVLTNIPTILVGGTNGKGSTCAYIESILRHLGFKTGLYTSPHLLKPNERIRINNIPVKEAEIINTLKTLIEQSEKYLKDASFFELMTAAALLIFQIEKVDVIVCEVGLGGQFDSTNALAPTVSVLTSVALDHTHILGKTLSKIATDKSHIARRNKPFIINDRYLSPKGLKATLKQAEKIGAIVHKTSECCAKSTENIFINFRQKPYSQNIKTALCTVLSFIQFTQNQKLLDLKKIQLGVKKTFWPGRFDVRQLQKKTFIFDAAHNPEGIKNFINQYKISKFKKTEFHLLFASLNDKNWREGLNLIVPYAKTISITECKNERAERADTIFKYLESKNCHKNVNCISNLEKALIRTLSLPSCEPIVVIGSIAFIGSVFESLKLDVFQA